MAVRQGLDLSGFGPPDAEFTDGDWIVHYEGKDPSPGNHFDVIIEDATGQGYVFAGE